MDENLKPLSVPVRVGQAVDVVGQAGRPKTITGFQTHSTPVLLAAGDRAELATEKYYNSFFSGNLFFNLAMCGALKLRLFIAGIFRSLLFLRVLSS